MYIRKQTLFNQSMLGSKQTRTTHHSRLQIQKPKPRHTMYYNGTTPGSGPVYKLVRKRSKSSVDVNLLIMLTHATVVRTTNNALYEFSCQPSELAFFLFLATSKYMCQCPTGMSSLLLSLPFRDDGIVQTRCMRSHRTYFVSA